MTPLTLVIGNYNYSSWSLRAWIALRQAGAAFDVVRIPLDLPETKAAIAEWSPSGRVPLLRDGDLAIWESLAICEHAAECFPAARLWPEDRAARAIARAASAEMHAGFAALRRHMPMDCRARRPGAGRAPGVAEDIARIVALWTDLRTRFGAGGDMLFGRFTVADAMFAPVVSRFKTYGVALDGAARDYAEAVLALPAMREWYAAAEAETEVIENP